MGGWSTPFPGEQVDYHLKKFGHLPEIDCGIDMRLCEQEQITVVEGEHSTVYTNGLVGGWVETKTGALVSVEYAKSLNRAGRRKEGIKL